MARPPFRLRTMGGVDLTDADGRRVSAVLAQPKRLALLVYLAIEGSDSPVSRDSIVALLWPESSQARARRNLRNSLHFLRSALGTDVVESIGHDQVLLDHSVIQWDGHEPTSAPREIDHAGGFLEGFHISGATQEWEEWVDRVRRQVGVARQTGKEGPAQQSATSGSERERRPLERTPPGPTPASAPVTSPAVPRTRRSVASLLVAGIVAALWLGNAVGQAGRTAVSRGAVTLAVLPFSTSTSDSAGKETADILRDELVAHLARNPRIAVLPAVATPRGLDDPQELREALQHLRVDHVLTGEVEARQSTVDVRLELVAVKTGGVEWIDGSNVAPGSGKWLGLFPRWVAEISEAVDVPLVRQPRQLTADPRALDLYLRGRMLNRSLLEADSYKAEELLHQAIRLDSSFAAAYSELSFVIGGRQMLFGFPEEFADSAATIATTAIAIDSLLPEAHMALHFARFWQRQYHEAEVAAQKVLELQPSNFFVVNNLAFIRFYRGDYVYALKWSRSALEMAPPDWGPPRHMIPLVLGVLGDFDHARALREVGMRISPQWPEHLSGLILLHTMAGELDRARALADSALLVRGDEPGLLWASANVSLAEQDLNGAEMQIRKLLSAAPNFRHPTSISAQGKLGFILAAQGRTAEAGPHLRAARTMAEDLIRRRSDAFGPRLELAAIEAVQGDVAAALSWLEEARIDGWRSTGQFQVRPGLDSLHGLPEFETLLEGVRSENRVMLQRIHAEGLDDLLGPGGTFAPGLS
ncbi:MAG: hypothetical protein R3E10_14215 [Gemmatimonadota bacterium]